ncbi:MAG TPA: G1 family glutamic endopeptidase, partial [Solirubrobacteraceae bacterium]
IGLGGYRAHAKALEQIGTDADCTRAGQASYSSWLELVPAGPVALRIAVHPGDRMSATLSVAGHQVTLRLRDASTGQHLVKRLRMKRVDVSSAEWIVEAPSRCEAKCQTLALTDFGSASFTGAAAKTRDGHTGSLGDAAWSTTRLILRQNTSAGGEARHAGAAAARQVLATPGEAAEDGAFSVLWSQLDAPSRTEEEATPPPTLGGEGS